MRSALVVPAAGRGDRLGAGTPKALVSLAGELLLVHAVRRAVASGSVDVVVVVAPVGNLDVVADALSPLALQCLLIVVGGDSRQDSVRRGLAALPDDIDVVVVHDAARCLAPPALFTTVVAAVRAGVPAVIPGRPVSDTVKRVVGDRVLETVDRTELIAVQTPQAFALEPLRQAHAAAWGATPATDDAGMLEALGHQVRTVPGDELAFKVTTGLDLLLAEAVLRREASMSGQREPLGADTFGADTSGADTVRADT